ncbi:MAG: DNA polymerase III [Treponema sp.]|jgi:DNA polymerase-3 subunit gamma/tau|nr:DNA polymerase III [Treponema sp.]
MFENLLGQSAADRLREDAEAGLAPSMLFFGPPATGKGTAALELGRVLSCEGGTGRPGAPWNCPCPACARHRRLLHPDLLLMGPRSFSAEIAASSAVFLREEAPQGRILFTRALRKLLCRFSPILWEDDPKLAKLRPLLQSMEEDMESLDSAEGKNREKLCAALVKNALKLESEGLGDFIPVAQVRRAAYWGRLAPSGRRKLLVIEGADRMRDEARNSLLKILEEPPERLNIALLTVRREAILPTLLSRLRPYRFVRREARVEAEVIRRVFRGLNAEGGLPEGNPAAPGGLAAYLDSFLPVPPEKLYPLAAFFAASVALGALNASKRGGRPVPPGLIPLGKFAAPIARQAGLGEPSEDSREIVKRVMERAGAFEARSLFPAFLGALLSVVSGAWTEPDPRRIGFNGIWKKHAGEAEAGVGTWNQQPALALDRLITELKGAMAEFG